LPAGGKIKRIELAISPRDFKPEDVKPDQKLIGALYGFQQRR
jgi:hypothetical protein